jgi:tetratricopeptide (TPR) repeat protein
MDFNHMNLIVSDNIEQFQRGLNKVLKDKFCKNYTLLEKSEAFESLGTAQFYHGDYKDAVGNLELAIAPQYLELKSERSVVFIKVMLANLYCRFGDFVKAENILENTISISSHEYDDLVPVIQSNWAIVLTHLKQNKEAIMKAREALSSAALLHSKSSSLVSYEEN